MPIQRHEIDQLMLSLFDKEASYGAGPAGWTGASACSLLEFDDASAHEEWDDLVVRNDDVVGQEFAKKQVITRQGLRINYTEPRVKPNTMAGLMALALGTVTSAQDGVLTAYRHKVTPAARSAVPSIGAQVKHDNGRQYKYHGIKADGWTLAINESTLSFTSLLIGSGSRVTAADAFAASISEDWLLWGDAKIFVKAVSAPITVPATPAQGAANLGGSEVNLSTRIVNFSLAWANNLAAASGYRAGSAKTRALLHPARRSEGTMLTLGVEVDDTTEAAELDYYLNQSKLAFELNIDSGVIIAATGVFKYGAIIILPQVQFRSIGRDRGDQDQEVLNYEGTLMDDGTNPVINGFIYNAQSTYLA